MLVSYQWLREYVKLPDSLEPEVLAEKLKLSTVEVEDIKRTGELLDNVVVGKVIKAEKHPQADKLKVCIVDVGDEKLTIVCGGSNVREGMLCVVAKLGAKVKWHGEGEPVEMVKTAIRGVESNGMICGADEVGLEDIFPKKEEKEIVDLSDLKLKPGKPLITALKLNDVIFEIDNKSLSNRPDLWGHYGLAREVAALTNRGVTPLEVKKIVQGKKNLQIKIENSKECPRYMAIQIEGVKISVSPLWLRQRLVAAGVRPINNVVDVTNYVMLGLGQPLHAFDAREVGGEAGINIEVRASKKGEKFKTLDGKDRDLAEGTLLIVSGDKPVAIAGIMGGENSEVKNDTTSIVIEAANFSGVSIRKSSNYLNLRTDASARFEKKLDPVLCENGLALAVELILQINPEAKVVSKIADVGGSKQRMRPIEMPLDFIEKFSGVNLPLKTSQTILQRLGFGVEVKGKYLEVTVPSARAEDVVSPEAVVEEVLRIHGYQNVVGTLPAFIINPPIKNKLRQLERFFGEVAVRDFGYSEIYNYSFVSESQLKMVGESIQDSLELNNPLSKEQPYLRQSLLPNLLEVLRKNSDRSEIKIFEIGQTYQKDLPGLRSSSGGSELLPRQDTYFMAIFNDRKVPMPFWQVKNMLIRIFDSLGVQFDLRSGDGKSCFHPARNQNIFVGEVLVGNCFELHPRVAKNFGIEGRAGVLNINLSELVNVLPQNVESNFKSIAMHPEVERDLAFLIDKDVTNFEIVSALSESDKLLKKIEMFDFYEGEKLPSEKKSVAYHFVFGSSDRTLTSEEVAVAVEKIKNILKEKWQVEFR